MRPFLERHEDLELVGRYVFLKPLRHVVRYIFFDRTRSPNQFEVWWAAVNLCQPWTSHLTRWGGEIWGTQRQERPHPEWPEWMREEFKVWAWDDPDMPESVYEKLESEALPALRKVETLEKFMDFACDPTDLAVALGQYDSAAADCIEIHRMKSWYQSFGYQKEYDRVMKKLCPMLQTGDRDGIVNLLHEWESLTAKQFRITHIWEKTAFPLEKRKMASEYNCKDDTSSKRFPSRRVYAREFRLTKPTG